MIRQITQWWLKRSRSAWDDFWYTIPIAQTKAGVRVNEYTALNYSAVYNAVTLIAGTIAALPLHLYQEQNNGRNKKKKKSHHLYDLLMWAPNPETTAFNFREAGIAHVLTWGNVYIQKISDFTGKITELWLIPPNKVRPKRDNGRLIYEVDDGPTKRLLTREQILHIPGLGFDGVQGYSVVTMARESIALGMATEEFGARFFSNGTKPSGILEHPGKLGEEALKNLKRSLDESQTGLANAHKLMVLEEGMKWQALGVSPNDSQFLETRQFQIPEIARWFNVPPHKLKDLTKSSFSNIEQEQQSFVTDTILPWLVRIEQNLNAQLLTEAERGRGLYFKHNVEGLLRGDSAARTMLYQGLWNIGAITHNEIRAKEDMDAVDDGDERYVPLNMIPVSRAGDYMEPKAPAEEPPEPEEDDEQEEPEAGQETKSYWLERRSSVVARDRIQRLYLPILRQLAQRIVNREALAVKKMVERLQKERAEQGITEMIDSFYDDLRTVIRREFRPTIRSMTEAVQIEAAKEVGKKVTEMDADMERFARDYTDSYATRHAESSRGQLLALVDEAEQEELPDILTRRVDEWSETRADKDAVNETVRLSNAVAATVFFSAGLSAVWRTRGAKTCPYCASLEGRTVAMGEAYVSDGDELQPDGQEPMKIRGLKQHPPLHQGCDCYVAAG